MKTNAEKLERCTRYSKESKEPCFLQDKETGRTGPDVHL